MSDTDYVYDRLYQRKPLSLGEGVAIALGRISSAIRAFRWQSKITPALRERCIDYALRENVRGGGGSTWRAQQIAEYIAKGGNT